MSPLPILPENQYYVPEPRFEELQKRVERFIRRAAKIGKVPLNIEVVGEYVQPVLGKDHKPTGRVRLYKVVEVVGKAPNVAGYTFVAAIQHTEAGNIISKAPGCLDVVVPPQMRDGKPTCDHCKTRRARKDTFLLMGEDGIIIRVGRNCLADFLRGEDAAEALRLWALIDEIQRIASMDDDEGFGGFSGYLPSVLSYVTFTFRAITIVGWVSRSEAFHSSTAKATADTVNFAIGLPPDHPTMRKEWDELQPTEADREEAEKAIAWAQELEGRNDYEHNLKVACSLGYVVARNQGLVASATVAFRRFQEREVARAREAKLTAASTHFGKVDSRYIRKLTVTKSFDRENEFGLTVVYTLEDEQGNVFKWWCSGGSFFEGRPLKAGDEFFYTFTVKRHGEYQNTKETTIFRTTPSKEVPSHKWVGPDGEVFKTKRALLASEAT
jgi:hypothetical protein